MLFALFKKSSKFRALLPVLFSLVTVSAGNSGDLSTAPIEIRASIPPEDAGIINYARVPDETGLAVLIRAAYGIDVNSPDAVRFIIADGSRLPYLRDPSFDTVRVVKLDAAPDEQATLLWVAYDRSLEPYMPASYPPDRVIHIKVAIKDNLNNTLQPAPFEFKIESDAQKTATRQNLPKTNEFYALDPFSEYNYDAGIEVVDGPLRGAKVIYSSREPLTPEFGSLGAVEKLNLEGVRAVGMPVNLMPHTVFDTPVTLFLPIREDADIRTVGLAYHDGTQWMPAVDAEGNVLPAAEGWMVPGSRVDHPGSSPPLIELQVHHFSAAQAVVFGTFDGTGDKEEDKDHSGSNVTVYASCFINSAAPH
jgi:hypothetical protein